MLSLDEDEEAQKAADFWTAHKMAWGNYHLEKQELDKFAGLTLALLLVRPFHEWIFALI